MRAGVLLGLIAVYVPIAGAGPSLQRAAVMGAAAVVASLAARPASRAYALLLAAVVTLTVNPRAVSDVGWELSFAALVGILLVSPQLRRVLMPPLEGCPRAARSPTARDPHTGRHAGRAAARLPLRGAPAGRSASPACSRCPPWRR